MRYRSPLLEDNLSRLTESYTSRRLHAPLTGSEDTAWMLQLSALDAYDSSSHPSEVSDSSLGGFPFWAGGSQSLSENYGPPLSGYASPLGDLYSIPHPGLSDQFGQPSGEVGYYDDPFAGSLDDMVG